MLFEQQNHLKNSKLIQSHFQFTRISKRHSKLNQFKIPNPMMNTLAYCNNTFVPNMPTGIKEQLSQMEYLTFSNVNNLGHANNVNQHPLNKRSSRFSKRLMAMQSALQMQDLKFRNMDVQSSQQQAYCLEDHSEQENYLSMMEQQRESIGTRFVMEQNLHRDAYMDLDLDMCGQESQDTQIQYYQSMDISPQINYEQYESYLNV